MKKGGSVMDHFLWFDELCMSMQAIGAYTDLNEQLVVLIGSMSEDPDQIIRSWRMPMDGHVSSDGNASSRIRKH